MKISTKLVLAVVLIPFLIPMVRAATGFIGNTVSAALLAGSNVIGKVTIDQTTPGTTNLVAAGLNSGVNNIGTVSGSSVTVVGTGIARNVPVQTAVGCTTSNGQLLPGNATRVGLECDADCNNTDRSFVNWGTVAATNTMKRLEPCSSWTPINVSTVAIQCLANSGTQNIRCIEYNSL